MSELKLKVLIGNSPAELEKQVEDFLREGNQVDLPKYSSHYVQGGAGKGGEKLIAYIHYVEPIDVMPSVVDIVPVEAFKPVEVKFAEGGVEPIPVELDKNCVVVEPKKEEIVDDKEHIDEGDSNVEKSE